MSVSNSPARASGGQVERLRAALEDPEVQLALARARADPTAPESQRLLGLVEIARTLLGEKGEGGRGSQ